jgi:hypothetical protein
MKHIHSFESFINEAQKGKTVRDNNLIYFTKMSDADHTRLVKWMGQNLDAPDYKFTKGGRTSLETHTLDVSALSNQDLNDLFQYMESQKYPFSTTIWLPAFESSLNEKDATRDEVMNYLTSKYKIKFVKPSEEFSKDYEGGIWIAGDNGETLSNGKIFDYYNNSSKYKNGILKNVVEVIGKMGWSFEWNDPGTVLLFPNK